MFDSKKLGFGLMRLPKVDGVIDLEHVKKMVDYFLANGFTYFDTAYVYENSEVTFKESVSKRYPRDAYTVADKLPGWKLTEGATAEDLFNTSLERCGVEYFDYYLLHSIQDSSIKVYNEAKIWEFCLKKKEEGKIKHFGFSFHGTPALLEEILSNHPEVEFVQLQINYLDWDNALIASRENYEICRRYNKPIIIMEPVKGGMLANLQPTIAKTFKDYDKEASVASYALRYAASLEGVKMVLSGMSNEEQLIDNVKTFKVFNEINAEELALINQVKNAILSLTSIGCTNCRYCCEDCPQKINIPEYFKLLNQILATGNVKEAKNLYNELIKEGYGKAKDCIECGQCEGVCPQHLNIINELKKVSRHFDKE